MPQVLLILALTVNAGAETGEYRTRNFVVKAPTKKIARQVGEAAERFRLQIAQRWLGKPLPAWKTPCPIQVKIGFDGTGGSTSFVFDKGQVLSQSMIVEGNLDKILTSAVPHEVAHTILGHHFRRPLPRWADEGLAILAENAGERRRYELLARKILNERGRIIPLARLFAIKDYPRDVIAMYAQGSSVARFLVEKKGIKTFLAFVKDGLDGDWEVAVRAHYGHAGVAKLEEAWLKSMLEERVEPY